MTDRTRWRGAQQRLAPFAVHLLVTPALLAGVVACIAVLRLAVGYNEDSGGDILFSLVELSAALTTALVGAMLIRRTRGSAVGWLLQLAALLLAVSALCDTSGVQAGTWLPFGEGTQTVRLWVSLLGRVILLAAGLVALPDRLAPGRVGGGPGTALAAALSVGLTAGLLVERGATPQGGTPFGFGNRAWIDAANAIPSWVFVLLLVVHGGALLFLTRQRGGEPTLFQVVGWGLAAGALPHALPALGDRLPATTADILVTLTIPALPVVSVVAFLRGLSWTVNRLVSRTVVWTVLSLGVLLAQALAVAVAALAGGRAGFITSVVASVAVAAGFQAVRSRLQGSVDRLIYGAGRDPAAALADLGRRFALAVAPEGMLPELATAVADAFGAGIRVELVTPMGVDEVARAGSFDERGTEHTWPLLHQGERIGTLVAVAPVGAPFRAVDVAALGTLAAQAAVVAHGVRVSLDLRRSNEALVSAVEEERRRLQRDLHDGLGPTLAGVALGLRAARNQLSGEQPAAEPLLDRLTTEMEASVEEVRRIVHGLRPAVLDQLGLVAAIRAHAERCSSSGLSVTIEVDGLLPVLSAATEVAAYRIVVESLTNVLKHAHATQCHVRLHVHDGLVVEVTDDGVGLESEYTPGVGLASMRDRATGVGGRFLISVGPDGGTRVVAALPTEMRSA